MGAFFVVAKVEGCVFAGAFLLVRFALVHFCTGVFCNRCES